MESFSESMYSFPGAGLIPVHVPLAFSTHSNQSEGVFINVHCENLDLTADSARYTRHAHIRILTVIPVTAIDAS